MLLRHVVAGEAVRVSAGESSLTTASGETLTLSRDINDIFSESVVVQSRAGAATITQLDLLTRDGVVHAINSLI